MSGYAAIIGDAVKLWVSDLTDSHTEIATEFKLRDNGKHRLYAFEFYPDQAKPSPETATWVLRWDSDATLSHRDNPTVDDENRFRTEIEKVAAKYVFRDGSHKTTACRAWVFGEAELTAEKSSSVVAWDSSSVVAWGSSSVVAWDSSSVVAWDSSRVVARDSSRVEARDSSSVEARDSSSVVAWGSSRVEARDSSSVVAWGSSSVVARGSSTTNSYGPKPKSLQEAAVWIDRTGDRPVAIVAGDNAQV
jgi:hypothetical protein